jgi:hypothetical protein
MPIEIRIGRQPEPLGEQPWLARKDWTARLIKDEAGSLVLVLLWGFSLVWYGVLALVAWAMGTSSPTGSGGAGVVLIVFAVAGLLPLVAAVFITWHALRFPRSTFELDAVPFALGGWVSGVVEAPASVAGAETLEVALDCVDVVVHSRSTFRTTKWRQEVTVDAAGLERRPKRVQIPVAIAVPADALATTRLTAGSGVEWMLSVKAALPGLDYRADFIVPVFAVEGPPSAPPRPLSPIRGLREGEGWIRPASSRIRVEGLPDGVAFQYPTPSWLAYWTIGPLLLVPAAALVGRLAFAEDVTAFWICVGVGAGLAVLALAIALLGVLTNPNRVEIRGHVVVVRRGIFGRGWDRRIPRPEVVAVKHVPVQNGPRVGHSVDIETRDGKSHNAALGLRDLAEAKWLADEMGRRVAGR